MQYSIIKKIENNAVKKELKNKTKSLLYKYAICFSAETILIFRKHSVTGGIFFKNQSFFSFIFLFSSYFIASISFISFK